MIFNPQTENKLSAFFKNYPLTTYKKGDMISRPQSPPNTILFSKSGYVRLYTISKEGKETTINGFKPVFCISLLTSYIDQENRYYLEAVTPAAIWKAPKDKFDEFVRRDTDLLMDVGHQILLAFNETLRQIEYLSQGSAYNKISTLICSLATRFGTHRGQDIVVDFKTTHETIASLVGITRETTTHQLLKLKEEGLISYEGKNLVVHDLEKLQKRTI